MELITCTSIKKRTNYGIFKYYFCAMDHGNAMQIYNDRSAKFRNTQSIQWKMNLSIWTVISLATYYTATNLLLCLIISVILLTFHGMFVYKIQYSLSCDKAVLDHIVNQLNRNVKNVQVSLKAKPKPEEFNPWDWVLIQVSVTFTLCVALCTTAYFKEFGLVKITMKINDLL